MQKKFSAESSADKRRWPQIKNCLKNICGNLRESADKKLACLFLFAAISLRADTVAFFYALEKDFDTLKAEAQPGATIKVGSRSVASLTLGAHKVYAVKMGSGAVETAVSAQALLAKVRCDVAFSVGPVGALTDAIAVGSWARVTNVVCYQKGAWTTAGFQISPNASVVLTNAAGTNLFSPVLFTNAANIKVASGEIFSASENFRAQLRDTTSADAVDMNLFGLTTVCADHRLPLQVWRVVSDRANDSASEDFKKFVATYDGAGGKAIAEIIKALPANPNSPESYPNLKRALEK
jgi:nucleoside phosphorylase